MPAAAGADADDDLMGLTDSDEPGEWNGPACEACTEATLCLLWETGRGAAAGAAARCGAEP